MIIFFFGRETPLFWTRKRTLHNNITKLYGKSYLSLHAFYDHSIVKRQLSLHMIMIN